MQVMETSMEIRVETDRGDYESRPSRLPPAKYPHAKEVFALWGKYPLSWGSLRESRQREAAENLYVERGVEQIKEALQFVKDFGTLDFFPTITSPHDLDSKWAKLETFSKKLAKKL